MMRAIKAAVTAASLAMCGPVLAQVGAKSDGVAARFENQTISRAEVLSAQHMLPHQYRSSPPDVLYRMLLDEVIDGRILALEARKLKLHQDPEIKRRLARIEEQVLREAFVTRHIAKTLPEAEQRKRYAALVGSINRPEEVRARHILVKTKDEAEAVIKQLQGGGDFAAIAKEKSSDGSASDGGDLGYFTREGMVAPFAEAAFSLKPGELSASPVETEFGWHVIKLEDRRLTEVPPFEEVREQLFGQLTRNVMLEYLAKRKSAMKIELFNYDGTPSPKR